MESGSDKLGGLPRRLGRYVLLSRLDHGGMTEVYAARLAKEVGPGRLLVIKILPQSKKDNSDAEVRFLEEARIFLNLTHGNITAAFEFGREEGRPFLVMEYVPGPSLRHLLDFVKKADNRLGIQDALFVVREVSRALGYAHSFSADGIQEKGIVHRDISPDNILISTTGQVKLTDFGIAQFARSGIVGPLWGKAAYIAPEVAAGEMPGPASDIYSLGAVLYECLTGVLPLKGETDRETLQLLASTAPEPPSSYRPDIPEELDHYVCGLLSKNPDERPVSASKLEVEIRSLLNDMHFSYSEPALAETVKQYFTASEYLNPFSNEHIQASMMQASISPDGGQKTVELIATSTVQLGDMDEEAGGVNEAQPEETRSNRRRLFLWGGIAVAVLAVFAVFGLGSDRQTKQDNIPFKKPHSKGDISGVDKKPALKPLKDGADNDDENGGPSSLDRQSQGGDLLKTDKSVNSEKKPPLKLRKKTGRTGRSKNNPNGKEPEWGWLNINSYPWSYVKVDGRKLNGHTPLSRVKLKRGSHTLVFENPDLGLKAKKKVDVKAWEVSNIGVRLE